jgi:protein phosphatase
VQIGYISDIGKRKESNEDSILCLRLDAQSNSISEMSGLFIVADGMGGHNAGEIASKLGIRLMARVCLSRMLGLDDKYSPDEPVIGDPGMILHVALGVANSIIYNTAKKDNSLHGMGTTISAALIIGQDLYIINAGDSRCYIINEKENIRVTKDHSLVQEMVDAGLITPAETATHPQKNILTRVVGYDNKVKPDSYHRRMYQGDHILICSDGLWSVTPDQRIREIILAAATPQQACIDLVDQANQLGGPDNISVIVVKPDNLPVRQDIMEAETQILQVSELQVEKNTQQRKGLFSFFHQ